MAKSKKSISAPKRKRVSIAEAENNLRRGNELYALAQQLPKMLDMKVDYAKHSLAEVKTANVPEHLKYDITSAAHGLLKYVEMVREHVDRGEIGQAVLAAANVGLMSERIVRYYFQKHVERNNESNRTLASDNQKRQRNSHNLYAEINAEVAKGKKRRGTRKQPSDYALLTKACTSAGLKDVASYYRIQRKLKK